MATEGFLDIRSPSAFSDVQPTACERIQDCCLSLIGRGPRNRSPRRNLQDTHFPSLTSSASHGLSSFPGTTSMISSSTIQGPTVQVSSSTSSSSTVQAPSKSIRGLETSSSVKNATLKLWIRDACNFHHIGAGGHDLEVYAEVGSAFYSTQLIKKGKKPAWEASRKFSFKLDDWDTEVAFKLFSTLNPRTVLAMAVLPISLCLPKITSFQLALTSHDSEACGEIFVDACLVLERSAMYDIGSYVQIINPKKSNPQWESAIVEDFTEIAKRVETEDKSKSWKVEAGYLMVRKSNGCRWLAPTQQSVELKKPCDWVPMYQGRELPARYVSCSDGRGNVTYIGRNEFGEVGRIATTTVESDEQGQLLMDSLSCYDRDAGKFAEVLVTSPGFLISWQKIKKGSTLPRCAVQSSLQCSNSRYCCVGRTSSGEVGSLIVSEDGEEKTLKMDEIRIHKNSRFTEGEVLVVEEAHVGCREFDLEICSLDDLKPPEYRAGDITKQVASKVGVHREYHPFVHMKVSGATVNGSSTSWESSPASCHGTLELHKHMRLVAVGDLADVLFDFKVSNHVTFQGIFRGHPEFGHAKVPLATLLESSNGHVSRYVSLERDGDSQGILKISLREIVRGGDDIEKVPFIDMMPALAQLTILEENALTERLFQSAGDDKEYKQTLAVCLESVLATQGGLILFVKGDHEGPPQLDGLGLGLDTSDVRCDWDKFSRFKELLQKVATSTSSAEIWTEKDLESFNFSTSRPEQTVNELRKKPKGGCIVLSKSGNIEAAAAVFQFHGYCPYRFPTCEGQDLEARHCMAIRVVHWLSCKKSRGVVFARFENGDTFVVLPSKEVGGTPDVFKACSSH